ncbi:MAG: cell wall hydrolase [Clostridia bacterium]|nr:cell wall hydrolase [Clostridia bacterium]
MAYSDRELLARLIECEAGGEGDIGMKAVASVIMNRVQVPVGEYSRVSQGGSIRNIIMQPGQFECVRTENNGVYNPQNIYNMNPTQVHYDIADWAIAGNRLPGLGNALWFYNPFSAGCRPNFPSDVGYFIGSYQAHCFYDPTDLYEFT